MVDAASIVGSCSPINTCMRFYEFVPEKPVTPAQGRISSLKRQIEVAKKALAHERKLQAQQKIQLRMQKLAAQKV